MFTNILMFIRYLEFHPSSIIGLVLKTASPPLGGRFFSTMNRFTAFFLLLVVAAPALRAQSSVTLANDHVRLVWQKTATGFRLAEVAGRKGRVWVKLPNPSGEQTLLFSSEKPSTEPAETFKTRTGVDFPEENYK